MTSATKTAFCFPGVGVKHCGAELGFFKNNQEVMEPFVENAARFLGKDLLGPFMKGDMSRLRDRELQFFTYGYSVGVSRVCENRGLIPSYTSGYSFGVYGALFACGAVSFETGLMILDQAYHAMESTLPGESCSMGVVVGLGREEVLKVLEGGEFPSVHLTGTNSSTCQIVSGYTEPLLSFLERALACDALFADSLPVSIPYHHSEILSAVAPKFRQITQELKVDDPRIPLVSTIDQRLLGDAEALKEFVTMNLCSPINWLEVVSTLRRLEVATIVECGPGISLSQNGRFMDVDDMGYLNVKNIERKLGS